MINQEWIWGHREETEKLKEVRITVEGRIYTLSPESWEELIEFLGEKDEGEEEYVEEE